MKIYTRITCLLLIASLKSAAQLETLKSSIETLCKTKNAIVGVALYDFQNRDTLSINGDKHFPMQSVFKFHIALTVFNELIKRGFTVDKKIVIAKKDLLPNTWSPLREDHPNGAELSIKEIMSYMVSQSDNNACDILIRFLGNPQMVDYYIHDINIKDFSVQVNEEEMAKEWNVQFKNWITPKASTEVLKMVNDRKILSQEDFNLLWKMLIETSTGPKRLKAGVPSNAVIAHKTGTSGTKEGITAAINDIGIIKLSNGKRFAISVFVCNSKETMEANEQIIADIAKLASDYFSK